MNNFHVPALPEQDFLILIGFLTRPAHINGGRVSHDDPVSRMRIGCIQLWSCPQLIVPVVARKGMDQIIVLPVYVNDFMGRRILQKRTQLPLLQVRQRIVAIQCSPVTQQSPCTHVDTIAIHSDIAQQDIFVVPHKKYHIGCMHNFPK